MALRVIFLSELCMALSVVFFHAVLHKTFRGHGENSASRVASHCNQLASRWSFSFFHRLIEFLWMPVLLGICRVIAKTARKDFAACTTIQLQFSVGRYRGSFSLLGVCFGCILSKFTLFLTLSCFESNRERCTVSFRYRFNRIQNFSLRCFRDNSLILTHPYDIQIYNTVVVISIRHHSIAHVTAVQMAHASSDI